jgi:hypothetical protein
MEKRNNSGVLSKNQNPKTDKSPPYTGEALIDGKEFWVSGWVRENSRGKFFSLSFRPKDQKRDGFEKDLGVDANRAAK